MLPFPDIYLPLVWATLFFPHPTIHFYLPPASHWPASLWPLVRRDGYVVRGVRPTSALQGHFPLCPGWLLSALTPFQPRASLFLAREGLSPLPLALALMHFHHCFDSRHSDYLTSPLVFFFFHLGIHLLSSLVLIFPAFFSS
jgi:hypothetical protein